MSIPQRWRFNRGRRHFASKPVSSHPCTPSSGTSKTSIRSSADATDTNRALGYAESSGSIRSLERDNQRRDSGRLGLGDPRREGSVGADALDELLFADHFNAQFSCFIEFT